MRGVDGSDYINASHIDVSGQHCAPFSSLSCNPPAPPPTELPLPEGLHCHPRASEEHGGRLLAHGVEVQQLSGRNAHQTGGEGNGERSCWVMTPAALVDCAVSIAVTAGAECAVLASRATPDRDLRLLQY